MKTEHVNVKKAFTARDAANVVECCNRFASEILFRQPGKTINAKSLMGTISLGLKIGDEFTIAAKGDDEEVAIFEISRFFA